MYKKKPAPKVSSLFNLSNSIISAKSYYNWGIQDAAKNAKVFDCRCSKFAEFSSLTSSEILNRISKLSKVVWWSKVSSFASPEVLHWIAEFSKVVWCSKVSSFTPSEVLNWITKFPKVVQRPDYELNTSACTNSDWISKSFEGLRWPKLELNISTSTIFDWIAKDSRIWTSPKNRDVPKNFCWITRLSDF